MTLEQLNEKVRSWDLKDNGTPVADSHFQAILDQLYYHSTREWRTYLPAQYPDFNASYMERLAAWIGNTAEEADQKLLLEYASYISFFSHDDFIALYRTAFDREITRWVSAQIGATLISGGCNHFQQAVHYQIHRRTWFCPITDSMDINEFYKVNHLTGISLHPAIGPQFMFAKANLAPNSTVATGLTDYMNNPNIGQGEPAPSLDRLVLLEDMVGSASQCLETIRWAVSHLKRPVLFVPLILCPNGVEALRAEERQSNGRLTVRPVIELHRGDLLGPERKGERGWPISAQLEDFTTRYKTRASRKKNVFGFKSTGCSLAMFSNTPNNTLPVVHNKTSNWEPLFPRVSRE